MSRRGTWAAVEEAQRKADRLKDAARRASEDVRWRKIAFLDRHGWQHRGVRTGTSPWSANYFYFLTPGGQWYSIDEACKAQIKRARDASRRAARKAGK